MNSLRKAALYGRRNFDTRNIALNSRGVQIGWAGVLGLVLLRITVGWHFLYQGMAKFEDVDFTSRGFLSQAKGPLATHYKNLIPDYHGLDRLERDKVLKHWDEYRGLAAAHYGFSPEQQKAADRLRANRDALLTGYLAEHEEDIDTYRHQLKRWEDARGDRRYSQVAFQQKRIVDEERKLEAQAKPWLAEIDRLTAAWHEDLDRLATAEQRARGKVPAQWSHLDWADWVVKLTNVAIGVCLMIGLLTRLAAWGGAAFLLTLVLAQFPWPTVYPPDPPSAGRSLLVNKEVVEMMALVAIGLLPVGRWAGLDFIWQGWLARRRGGAQAA